MSMGNSVLAAMITPAMFYAGLACAAVPILIHLLSRRRFRRIRWAATQFLLEANRQNRRRIRIQELILLALRCLAMLLIGMVLARVFVRPHLLAGLLGSKAGTQYIVLLDDSFSMGLLDSDRQAGDHDVTVFGRALAVTERLAGWLREESPGDALTILLTSRPDQPVLSESNVGTLDPAALSGKWRSRKPSFRRADLPRSFSAAGEMLDNARTAEAVIYLISDFQRADWVADGVEKSSKTAGGALDALSGWNRADRSLKVILVDVGSEKTDNLAVTHMETRQPQAIAGIGTRLLARVTNFGSAESRPCTLQVFVEEAGQPAARVPAIPPGESLEIGAEVTFLQAGPASVTVRLQSDALPADDQRFGVIPVVKALRLLIVNGEPSTDPYEDEAFLLSTALRPVGPQFSGNAVSVIQENEFEQADLDDFHAVVLLNVARISEATAGRLESYVAAGGGLAVFTGDQVDTQAYNQVLYHEGSGLLPGRLSEPVATPGTSPGLSVGRVNTSHPALRAFANLVPTCFEGVLVWAYFPLDVPVAATTQPAATNPAPSATNLLELADVDKSPLIIERSFHAGRVWLVTTSADKEWNNLPDHPVFVVLMMEMMQHLARRPTESVSSSVGQVLTVIPDAGRYQSAATVRGPTYPEEPAATVQMEARGTSGKPVIQWDHTEQAGIYSFELTDQAGIRTTRPFAVNVDTAESDLRRARRDELEQVVAGWPVEYVRGEDLSRASAGAGRRELWPLLLTLLVLILMAEQMLAWWFGANRQWSALFRGKQS